MVQLIDRVELYSKVQMVARRCRLSLLSPFIHNCAFTETSKRADYRRDLYHLVFRDYSYTMAEIKNQRAEAMAYLQEHKILRLFDILAVKLAQQV